MHKLTRMRLSRDDWKDKARNRADELREMRRTHKTQKQTIAELKQEIDAIKKKNMMLNLT